ncbi:DUF2079 domain-containing protein [Patescibacteria group bacterium]|nr:DUF2079 domain-containing protein [Patescibacteria group bacterium]
MKITKIILWLLIISYTVFFSYLSIKRYRTLNSHYYDLGIMNQTVYNTSQGHFLEMTDQTLKKNISRLAVHFDPILAAFAPFYKIYPGAETLLIGQTVIVALGALAVYLLAEKILKKEWLSLLFSVLYLLYFPVSRANLFDFHAVVLATTFFLFAIYFYLSKKKFLFFFFVLLSLLTKEHVGLVVAFLGVYIFIFKKDKKTGLTTFLLGMVFFIATVYFIIPYFRQQTHFALRYFQDFGDSPTLVVFNLVRYPLYTIRYFFHPDVYTYLFRLFSPMFYSLFSPFTLLIALPELAINVFSLNSNMRAIFFHYNAIIVPFVFYSSILGYKFLDERIKSKLLKNSILVLFIFSNLYSVYLYSPLPLKFLKDPLVLRKQTSLKLKTVEDWEEKLKDPSIKVATTPILAPYFTEREYYYNFLFDPAYASMGYTDEDVTATSENVYKMAEYVIIDRAEIGRLSKGTLAVKFYQNFLTDRNYRMIFSDDQGADSIEVYQRVSNL